MSTNKQLKTTDFCKNWLLFLPPGILGTILGLLEIKKIARFASVCSVFATTRLIVPRLNLFEFDFDNIYQIKFLSRINLGTVRNAEFSIDPGKTPKYHHPPEFIAQFAPYVNTAVVEVRASDDDDHANESVIALPEVQRLTFISDLNCLHFLQFLLPDPSRLLYLYLDLDHFSLEAARSLLLLTSLQEAEFDFNSIDDRLETFSGLGHCLDRITVNWPDRCVVGLCQARCLDLKHSCLSAQFNDGFMVPECVTELHLSDFSCNPELFSKATSLKSLVLHPPEFHEFLIPNVFAPLSAQLTELTVTYELFMKDAFFATFVKPLKRLNTIRVLNCRNHHVLSARFFDAYNESANRHITTWIVEAYRKAPQVILKFNP